MKDILLIWDIDGTLIDSKGCGRRAMDRAFYTLFGIENGFKDVKMAGRLDALIVKDAMDRNNVADGDIILFFNTYCQMLEEEIAQGRKPEILPGIKEILERREICYRLYHVLGTGNMEQGARLKLSPHNINRYFPVGGFGDEEKERWQIIQHAIEKAQEYTKINFKKENIYVIGDTPLDIQCGKILEIKSIAVATGSHSMEELIRYQPDYLFPNFGDTDRFFEIFR